jgi:large subunit ribosomal protein L15
VSPHKLRKTRKRRGFRTVGWGQVGQHRKHSQKGGRRVGRHKHLWSYVIRYEPDYFGGKKGFTSPRALKQKINVINVGELDELVDKLAKAKQLETREEKAFLDLEKLGYNKLLATGRITKPLIVKVAAHSENAAKKVEEAGGQILGAATAKEEVFEESEAVKSEETAAKT